MSGPTHNRETQSLPVMRRTLHRFVHGGALIRAAMDKAVEHSLISGVPAARSAAGTKEILAHAEEAGISPSFWQTRLTWT